jgi:multidrug resistance efflux pump
MAAEIVRTSREYIASLERMRAAYQQDAAALAEMVEVRRDLYQRQIISKREVEIAEEALAAANRKVEEADRAIRDASTIRESILGEAALHAEIAKTALPAGGYPRHRRVHPLQRHGGIHAR